jgi:hypothetical protein
LGIGLFAIQAREQRLLSGDGFEERLMADRLPQGLLPVDPCRLVFVLHRALDALPRRASNFHPFDSRIDLNELAKTSGMAQGPKPLESIRSMIRLLHDDPREDGESGSIDVGDSTLPSGDSLRRRVEQVG